MNIPSFCKNFKIQSCIYVHIHVLAPLKFTIDLKINKTTANGVVAWATANFDIATLKVGRRHQKYIKKTTDVPVITKKIYGNMHQYLPTLWISKELLSSVDNYINLPVIF